MAVDFVAAATRRPTGQRVALALPSIRTMACASYRLVPVCRACQSADRLGTGGRQGREIGGRSAPFPPMGSPAKPAFASFGAAS